jgi:predicted alpha/beta superfamily hydrolase
MRKAALVTLLLLAACNGGSSTPDASPRPERTLMDSAPLPVFEAGPVELGASDRGASDRGAAERAPDGAQSATTTIRVHYPAGTSSLTIRGSAAPLSWTAGQALTAGADDTWTFTTTALKGSAEWKPLLGDQTWSLGPNYHVSAGQTLDVYPRFTTVKGKVEKLVPDFASSVLVGTKRNLWAYLPPTYLENSRAKMPVVYMHDGQNLFDPALAFGGNPWHADDAVDAAASAGVCPSGSACQKDSDCGGAGSCETFREAIIIGVENTVDRMAEYTPVPDPKYGGGKGDLYLKMLVTEVKPKIDALLRTRPEREHTALIGSSLGGLISAHAGLTQNDTFGLIGAMSPSTWWAGTALIASVTASAGKPRPLRLYVDSGDSGASKDDVVNTNALAAAYLTVGFVAGKDFLHVVAAGHEHSEIYWAQRLPGALRFLLGPRP